MHTKDGIRLVFCICIIFIRPLEAEEEGLHCCSLPGCNAVDGQVTCFSNIEASSQRCYSLVGSGAAPFYGITIVRPGGCGPSTLCGTANWTNFPGTVAHHEYGYEGFLGVTEMGTQNIECCNEDFCNDVTALRSALVVIFLGLLAYFVM